MLFVFLDVLMLIVGNVAVGNKEIYQQKGKVFLIQGGKLFFWNEGGWERAFTHANGDAFWRRDGRIAHDEVDDFPIFFDHAKQHDGMPSAYAIDGFGLVKVEHDAKVFAVVR